MSCKDATWYRRRPKPEFACRARARVRAHRATTLHSPVTAILAVDGRTEDGRTEVSGVSAALRTGAFLITGTRVGRLPCSDNLPE
jgi:hypothetical protein